MQPIRQPLTGGYGLGAAGVGQYGPNQYFNVPTQNKFGPLGEWVGYSMGIHEPIEESCEIEVQWIPVQNKRKRYNTGNMGAGMESNFSSFSMDEKLSHMYEKLQNLEQSNQTIAQFCQNMNIVQSKVGQFENKLSFFSLYTALPPREDYVQVDCVLKPRYKKCTEKEKIKMIGLKRMYKKN